ncbi:MAG: hypothetical protein ACJ8LG_22315 [Massilia sp.]
MDATRLAAEVESQDLHRNLLGSFKGPYSLGVGRDHSSLSPVLLLMVPPEVTQAFPAEITVAGETVPVVVRRALQQPVTLAAGPRPPGP